MRPGDEAEMRQATGYFLGERTPIWKAHYAPCERISIVFQLKFAGSPTNHLHTAHIRRDSLSLFRCTSTLFTCSTHETTCRSDYASSRGGDLGRTCGKVFEAKRETTVFGTNCDYSGDDADSCSVSVIFGSGQYEAYLCSTSYALKRTS